MIRSHIFHNIWTKECVDEDDDISREKQHVPEWLILDVGHQRSLSVTNIWGKSANGSQLLAQHLRHWCPSTSEWKHTGIFEPDWVPAHPSTVIENSITGEWVLFYIHTYIVFMCVRVGVRTCVRVGVCPRVCACVCVGVSVFLNF